MSQSTKTIVVNRSGGETRLAVIADTTPVEFYVQRTGHHSRVGSIYKGRVVKVLPGMQAAFVDVGLERTAYLYVDDAGFEQAEQKISDIVKAGQEVLVQVKKDAIGTKGARITRQLTVPGRGVVYLPYQNHRGVSQRIESEDERERLREILEAIPLEHDEAGLIARTAAEGMSQDDIHEEASSLQRTWQGILEAANKVSAPSLVHRELDLVLRTIRDFSSDLLRQIVTDNADDYRRINEFIASQQLTIQEGVQLHQGPEPIFDKYGVEVELDQAMARKVWLRSGGYLIFDQAEALSVVDVNSGKFVGKKDLEETITQINLEAAREIARQIRLRNMAGIIIIDFIDMENIQNRDRVLAAFEELLKDDRVKTTIVRFSELGLLEMTRKRTSESLEELLCDECPNCKGRGRLKSVRTVCYEILRHLRRQLQGRSMGSVLVNMNADIADHLYDAMGQDIEAIESEYSVQVIPVAREGFAREHYDFVFTSASN